MPPSVDVVVPVHNNWELTESCLEHLRLQTLRHTVIVCDNGSTDGTPEHLRASYPEVWVVELGQNLGFSVACNRGVQVGSGEIVVLVNNDVDCRPEFLERLVAPFDDERLGSVAALLLKPGKTRIESFGLTVDPTLAGFPRFPASRPTGPEARPCSWGPRVLRVRTVEGRGRKCVVSTKACSRTGRMSISRCGSDPKDGAPPRRLMPSRSTSGSASARSRSAWQRYQAGFARGYFLRRYGILRGAVGLRAAVTEAIVVLADALIFSHDLASMRGRIAGWRAARTRPRNPPPPREALDLRLTFWKSLNLRFGVFTDREPPS